MAVTLHELLKKMVDSGATDLHITTNSPPIIRVHGLLERLSSPPLTASETKRLAYSVLTDAQKHRLEETLELDLSFGIKGLARFRANVFFQRGALAAAFRRIPYEILGFKELGLPQVVESLCEKPRGLVLVTAIVLAPRLAWRSMSTSTRTLPESIVRLVRLVSVHALP